MSELSLPVIQLNDHRAQNWKFDAGPVAMLNPNSSTHERIAYCWCLAENLEAIADLGGMSTDGDVSIFSNLISNSLFPLLATLKILADETSKTDCGGAV
jgi:hypothetical protein